MPNIPLAEKKTVLEILGSFKGTGPLRELLAQLNYNPLNEPVSRKDWPEPAKVALAQDPRIFGQAAGDFYVIYAQLAADKLKLTDERTVIPQLLKQYPYALFVFSDKSQTEFHFVNVKWENTQKRRLTGESLSAPWSGSGRQLSAFRFWILRRLKLDSSKPRPSRFKTGMMKPSM